ncbi:MAG TPA: S16 family serine protease [Candidatus Eisenbacteria bacterium]|nr:S16 family serine protease [Candidatus Eisenbacteria bacterium]
MAKPARNRSLQARRSLRATAVPEAPPAPAREDARIAPALPAAGPLPGEVARQAQREMDRLRRLPAGTPEAAQVRAYLHWLWSMPWEISAPEDADLRHVERVLEHEHLGLVKAKERVVEYLAVRRLKPDLPGPALCLVGPPGTGKTSLGSAAARALRRPFARLSVSGTSDAAELMGEPRNAPGAQPGKIVRALRAAGARNPVLMIDGIDRLSGEGGLGVAEVLLDLLDPETSSQFTDHYLGLSMDLSHAVVLMCANHLELIPDALQERLEVIEVPGYSEDEKIEIARRFLVPRQLVDHGLATRDLSLPEESLRAIVRHYTLEAGVRGLARHLAGICRKVARARATGDTHRHTVGVDRLEDYLGHRLYQPEMVGKEDEVGVAMGLAWTAAGGEVLVVEAIKMPGTGRVVLTGQLGEVMKESVQAAHSYVRSRADVLDIEAEAFSQYDIHIHFPAAGVPKDGPSAGITAGLVIASVLSDRPIRHDVALTGEVSLRGRVLVVGGLREKALAAYRAGFRALLFPAANVKDLDDVPEDVRAQLELVPVESMDDVFEAALSRVIVPQRANGHFVIEVPEEDGSAPAPAAPEADAEEE